jgi:hypothetical protein
LLLYQPASLTVTGRAGELGVHGGTSMPTGDQNRRPPAHAGRLPPWERIAIALVLAVMASLITLIVLAAGPSPRSSGPAVTPRKTITPVVAPAVESRTGPGSHARRR